MHPHPHLVPDPCHPAVDGILSARVHQLYGLRLEVERFAGADNGAEAFRNWLVLHCSLWMVLVRALQPDGPHDLDPETRLELGDCSPEAAVFLARSAESLSAQALWDLATLGAGLPSDVFERFRVRLRERQAQWLERMPEDQADAWQHFLAGDGRLA